MRNKKKTEEVFSVTDSRNRLLAEAGEILSSSLNYKTTLAGVARFLVPELSDWCAVDIIDDSRTKIQRLAIAHVDPEKIKWANEIGKRYAPNVQDPAGVPNVIRTGVAEIYPVITDEMLVAGIKDPEFLDLMRKVGMTSVIIAPLMAKGKAIGAITFVSAESKHSYTQEDLHLAQELAHLASIAIQNAQLYTTVKEAALYEREQSALLSTILRTAPVGFEFFDRNLRFIRVNDLLADLNGKTPEEHVGKTIEEIIPQHASDLIPILTQIFKTGDPVLRHEVARCENPDDCRYFEVNYYPVSASNGEIIGIAGISNEVTERRKNEQSKLYLASIVESSDDAIVGKSLDGIITSWNRGAERIYGYKENEAIGKSISILFPTDKGEELDYILRKINEGEPMTHYETKRIRQDGEELDISLTISPLRDSTGVLIGASTIARDITEQKKAERAIEHQARHDSLTDLDNRKSFEHKVEEALRNPQNRRAKFAVMFLDLDQFKNINDTLGHTVGDSVLRQLGKRLRESLRKEDIMARWGGDEFVFFMQLRSSVDVIRTAKKIFKLLRPVVQVEGYSLHVSGSMGIAMYPENGTDARTLLKNADASLYRAKDSGRNNFQLYDSSMSTMASNRLLLQEDLRHALINHQITFYYQAIFDTTENCIVGAEVLARWKHPQFGYLPPSQFISLAEETGNIFSLDEWKLKKSCAQNKEWQDMGFAPFRISANISAHHFARTNLIKKVKEILEASQLDPQYLELEITESVAMRNMPYIQKALFALKELGIKIAIDDFGTGQTSFAYLKHFPFDTIKIDQQFVQNCLDSREDAAIVQSMVMLAEKLNVEIIAEGVETKAQLDYLTSLGCKKVQGFFLNRPMPPKDFTQVIAKPNVHSGLF